MTAPNRAKRNRWLGWEAKARILENSAEGEPTKPSKPGSVGFVGATLGNSRKTETVLDTFKAKPPASFPTWAEFRATMLNQLFQEQGLLGELGRITAATVRHGENGPQKSGSKVDFRTTAEQPISPAEAAAD
jgi:hypothetical protein